MTDLIYIMGMQSSSSDSTSHQDELTWRAQHTPPPIPNPSRDNSRADRNSRFLPSALPTRGAVCCTSRRTLHSSATPRTSSTREIPKY
ncbi:hypothetical protein EN45_074950 [Penicillium chrysogenum]|uniref:Uncharacterized protein n=2 Tax=Penicillium chrysogenum TaxID=5076 RepID=A0A167U458_PENCH|nr:uncharacterized protein N7525_007807 [Penicillium rubens]KAJ5829554.1 hypothetical protein N7525_007807 [Penicillium rubens]KAJ5852892.1 hypothetical protein N7534_005435 [Penicillium rubens]KZN88903.1 hypothetical protein EN45_074950 [Penicillium chrysogenum]